MSVRRVAGILAVSASLALTACTSSSGGVDAPSPRPSISTDPTPSLLQDRGSDSFAFGNFVTFTASKGFAPQTLVVPFDTPIVWRNTAASPVTVRFDNYGSRVVSGPIAPGGTWSFNPHSGVSIAYHAVFRGHRYTAFIQAQLAGNSGA